MAVLKAMTSGGVRRELDFYPTPPEATRALLPLIWHWGWCDIWEPCCGEGAISKVFQVTGRFGTISSDIVDHGFGAVADFFQFKRPESKTIVTNPPFNRADEFIRHSHKIGVQRMALILKMNFWNAHTKRRETWETWRPYLIAPLTWRLDFTGAGRPHTDCMWCLWDRASPHVGTQFQPVHKPVQGGVVSEAA